MVSSQITTRVEKVREFNRFYTKQIGLLHEGLLHSQFNLTEARLLFEIAHHGGTTAKRLCAELALDAGYLSRIVKSLEQRRLISRTPAVEDGRKRVITLTESGNDAFSDLNVRSRNQFELMLCELSRADQDRMLDAMGCIESVLGASGGRHARNYILRPHKTGDIGMVIHRHAVLYFEEYGWDETFESLCAVILGKFVKNFDPKYEHSWIAEIDGEFAGCVFAMKDSDAVARLRLLLVEPSARGLGLGTRLVNECIEFCRRAGYEKLVLWTNDCLTAARRIYERADFKLTEESPHHSFGHNLVGQTWELPLITSN